MSPGWHDVPIDQALDRCAEKLIDRGFATPQRGYSARYLDKIDQALTRPMPRELRTLYTRVTPVDEYPPHAHYGWIGLLTPDQISWFDDADARADKLWMVGDQATCWLAGWAKAALLAVGYTPFGDLLLWAEGLRGYAAGTIVVTDHESDETPVVLGDSLGQWLARYHTFDLFEMAIAPAAIDDLDGELALAFVRDHMRLNPQSEWGKQKLRRLMQP